ncbi:MAG: carbonic anhydrase [Deltaproteobacteria bacterium]
MPRLFALLVALLLVATRSLADDAAHAPPVATDSPAVQQMVLQGLVDGNTRFVEEKQAPRDLGAARRQELAKGQHPRVAVLSCSDSRVPPELVFDQQLGEVFVVRTAGNVADGVALGSIDYAVEHLDIPVLVVLGHRSCGAVKAALEAREKGLHPHGNVSQVLKLVMPAVDLAARAKAPDLLNASIEANVDLEAKRLLKQSPILASRVKAGKLKIVTAIYDLESGKVKFATATPACAPPAPGRIDSPSVYAAAVVDALGWVRRATSHMPDDGPRTVPQVQAIFARTRDDFACAGRQLTPFVKSSADLIRGSAEALVTTCGRLQEATGAMSAALPSKDEGPMDEAVREKDQAWLAFLKVAGVSSRVLVEFRDEEPTGRLLVTKAERQSLKARLEKEFGKSIRSGRKDGQDPLTTVAAYWYELLANPDFRGLDGP